MAKLGVVVCSLVPTVAAGIAVPTKSQLAWQADEIGAIGHFNMGTFEGCGIGADWIEGPAAPRYSNDKRVSLPPAATFAPETVDAEGWVRALASFGAKRAVLVVSHGCGFNTFPSRTAFPEFQFEYNYSVKHSPWANGTGDIAKLFVAACAKYGIRPGFYHGAMNNAFLNVRSGTVGKDWIPGQARITQDQYTKILLANLRQLWTDYGKLAEVWFDGGYPPGTAGPIADLLEELQPDAVAFQGPGKNVIRWCGTEGGHVKPPFWSAAQSSLSAGKGDPNGAAWSPAEADTCFQGGRLQSNPGGMRPPADMLHGPYGGCWFYNAGLGPKSLGELVSSYHDTVGVNTYWLLDWTPNQTGMLRPDHVARYSELGSWLTSCYGAKPVANVLNTKVGSSGTVNITLAVPKGAVADRVVLREDQTAGQRITGFSVQAGSGAVIQGQSIGNRRIVLLPEPVSGSAVVSVKITSVISGSEPVVVSEASLFNCSREPVASGCSFIHDFAYAIVPSITIDTLTVQSANACCAACRSHAACAVFVFGEASGKCTIMSANQGGAAQSGAISGSPL